MLVTAERFDPLFAAAGFETTPCLTARGLYRQCNQVPRIDVGQIPAWLEK